MIGWKWPTLLQSGGDTILTIYRPAVHTLSDNETGIGRGGSQNTSHHITYTTYPSLYFHIHALTHNSLPATDQNKQRFLLPIIPMAGHGPEATPGVILMVENIWIKNREIYQLLLTRPSVCFSVSNIYNLKATINWSQEIQKSRQIL